MPENALNYLKFTWVQAYSFCIVLYCFFIFLQFPVSKASVTIEISLGSINFYSLREIFDRFL